MPSKVIVERAPNAQVRKNLAKLSRKPISVVKAKSPEGVIKSIYHDEGADECLGLCRHFKMTRKAMLLLLASFEK